MHDGPSIIFDHKDDERLQKQVKNVEALGARHSKSITRGERDTLRSATSFIYTWYVRCCCPSLRSQKIKNFNLSSDFSGKHSLDSEDNYERLAKMRLASPKLFHQQWPNRQYIKKFSVTVSRKSWMTVLLQMLMSLLSRFWIWPLLGYIPRP